MADAQLRLEDAVKASLLQTDESFRKLVLEHHDLDERIRQISTLTYVTDDQRYEEISLKKRKLALKDRIESMMRGHHGGSPLPVPSQ
jgi:uncharacterized protein YdcH (DUF465 family)